MPAGHAQGLSQGPSQAAVPPSRGHDSVASALRTLASEQQGLAALAETLGGGQDRAAGDGDPADDTLGTRFAAAVDAIAQASGRVIVTGMGKSGHIGRKIAATLASTGTPAFFVHPGEASHGDLGMIQAGDVVLALSWSGETAELSDIVAYAKRFRVALIAFTSNPRSALAEAADIALLLPGAPEACPNGLAPTTSTTMQLVLGDALAVALLEQRGFSPQDFKIFHPGGKLGAKLKHVRDVMHAGARLPIVPLGSAMQAAIEEMSAKGFGCVIVVDKEGRLAGIVTDGDLRRHLTPDLGTLPVDAVMTRQPRTIAPDALLATALDLQQSAKITALVVVENGAPVGLVHYLDLLREGVA